MTYLETIHVAVVAFAAAADVVRLAASIVLQYSTKRVGGEDDAKDEVHLLGIAVLEEEALLLIVVDGQ